MKLAEPELAGLRRRLLGWFRRNKRRLPWRSTGDPYRIWLAETMLQQTRVAAALPYYQRFLRRFPDVRRLARARLDEVLRLWAGLGYYGRARNLHRAARHIVARHSGEFPRQFEAALALPGVGRYTAAAVLSIAYGEPYAVLDGNVSRVLARLGAVRGELRQPRRWRALGRTAQRLLASETPGEWNQAMMELGATLCTPKSPRCPVCPISQWCRAFQLGLTDRLPAPRRKPPPEELTLAAAVLLDPRGQTLLVRGTRSHAAALFSRLWQFPSVRVKRDAQKELAQYLRARFALSLRGDGDGSSVAQARQAGPGSLIALPAVRHSVTYRKIKLSPFLVHVVRLPQLAGARTLRLSRLDKLPISSATRKIAASLATKPSLTGSLPEAGRHHPGEVT